MKKGFTLIELLIVVAIIAILAAIAVPNFLEAQTRAKVSRVVADQRTIATGLETYKIDNNIYVRHGIWANGLKADGTLSFGPSYNRPVLDPVTITTPIAYINSEAVTFDAFQAHLRKNVPKTDYDNWAAGRMSFTSYDGNAEQRASQGAQWFGLYRLSSAGPDQAILNGSIPPEGTLTFRLQNPRYRVYDATNGTMSAGDIWRLPKGDDAITRNFAQNN